MGMKTAADLVSQKSREGYEIDGSGTTAITRQVTTNYVESLLATTL
jgi:hypothetical protein